MNKNIEQRQGAFFILLASFLWATIGLAASNIIDVNPLATAAFATGGGGILLALKSASLLRKELTLMLAKAKLLVIGSVAIALYPVLFYTAMNMSGVALGTVISIATAPLFAAIFESFLSGKKVTNSWWFSFGLSLLGMLLLTFGKHENSIEGSEYLFVGVILACCAGASYAIYSWVAKAFIKSGVHQSSVMSCLFGFASILLLPTLLFTSDGLWSSTSNLLIASYMAVFPIFIGYLCFARGLKYIEASKATLLTLAEPLIATLFAVVLIGEQFSWFGWLGVGLILGCVYLQSSKES